MLLTSWGWWWLPTTIRDSTSNAPPQALQLGTPPMGTKMLTAPSTKPIVIWRNSRIIAVTTISGSATTAGVLATMCVITVESIATKLNNATFMQRKATRGLSEGNCICLTSLTCAKCGTRSTLYWKILNISDSTELFTL